MNKEQDDNWLDELISQSINTTKPRFDAEEWKTMHPDAFQSILSRRGKSIPSRQQNTWRLIFTQPKTELAAVAAVILVVTGLFLIRDKQAPNEPDPKPLLVAQSPTKIVSMMSLRTIYQRGGWEALDRQFQKTLETFGPELSNVSVQQLLEGLNGS